MEIFAETIERELPDLAEQGVRVRFIGRRDRAPETLQRRMAAMEDRTELNTRINLWVAFDYGGRAELVEAARRIVESGVDAARDRRERLRREPVCARAARSRSPDPHERRGARLELPALAARLLGARLRRQALAGLRRARPALGARGLRVAPSKIRRQMSNAVSRIVVALALLPVVLGAVYLGGWWLFALVAFGAAIALHEFWLLARPLAPARAGRLRRRGARARRSGALGDRAGWSAGRSRPSCSRSCSRRSRRRAQAATIAISGTVHGRGLDRPRARVPDAAARAPGARPARRRHGAPRGLGGRHAGLLRRPARRPAQDGAAHLAGKDVGGVRLRDGRDDLRRVRRALQAALPDDRGVDRARGRARGRRRRSATCSSRC